MERVAVEGGFVEAEARGNGDPVLLIHGSIFADAYAPLLREPALGRYRLISYHRRGFAGSSRAEPPFGLAQQAADALAVLRHFGVARAHIAGHSYGGATALQLALDAPEAVHSLGLLEPGVLVGESAAAFWEGVGQIAGMYEAGNRDGAIDAFAQAVIGPDYRVSCDAALPAGWFELAVTDVDTFFKVEVPALKTWTFTAAEAARVRQPALAVLGAQSSELFVESHAALKKWLPNVEPFLLADASHGLQMQNAPAMAVALADFFARNRIS